MYIETIYHMGSVVEVKRRSFTLLGAPGKRRKRKEKATNENAKKVNQKNKGRNLQRLLLANFKEGDLHIILQYKKEDRPDTYDDAQKALKLFIRRLKNYYKNRGYELKYIAITERGKKRAVLHHHLIMQSIDENGLNTLPAINSCWSGYVKASIMYEDGAFSQLADYLVKSAGKEEKKGASYIRSRNLTIPKKEKRIIFKKDFENPQKIEGYQLIADSIEEYQNEYGKHQRFLMKKIKEKTQKKVAKPTFINKIINKFKKIAKGKKTE